MKKENFWIEEDEAIKQYGATKKFLNILYLKEKGTQATK